MKIKVTSSEFMLCLLAMIRLDGKKTMSLHSRGFLPALEAAYKQALREEEVSLDFVITIKLFRLWGLDFPFYDNVEAAFDGIYACQDSGLIVVSGNGFYVSLGFDKSQARSIISGSDVPDEVWGRIARAFLDNYRNLWIHPIEQSGTIVEYVSP